MTKPFSTDVICLLDESTSMSHLRAETISGVNELIDSNRSGVGECRLSLYTFASAAEVPAKEIFRRVDIATAPLIGPSEYNPDGNTALFDASCYVIDRHGQLLSLLPEHERPSKVLFYWWTDGQNNNSVRHTPAHVRERINHQTEKYGWTFAMFGSQLSVFGDAGGIGLSHANVLKYKPTALGHRESYKMASMGVVATRNQADDAGSNKMLFAGLQNKVLGEDDKDDTQVVSHNSEFESKWRK